MNFFEDILFPIMTGGATKVIEGIAPESQPAKMLSDFVANMATGGLSDLYFGVAKATQPQYENLSVWEKAAMGADRAVDPGGVVDWGIREIGEELPQGVRNVAPELGATVGGVIGAVTPMTPAGGAAAGAGIGGKLAGDSYLQSAIDAAIAATTAYASQQVGGMFSSQTPSNVPQLSPEEYALQGMMEGQNMFGGVDYTAATKGLPTVEQGAGNMYSGMQYSEPGMFSLDNIMKALDIGKKAMGAFGGESEQQTAAERPMEMFGNPVFIPEDLQPYRSVSNERGLSGASRPSLFDEYDTPINKKKKGMEDFALMLKEYEDKKKEEGYV